MIRKFSFLLISVLTLSSFTHLWNPIGFPDIFFDEGVYMRRAVNILQGNSPQESFLYDHPYFGQIVLASGLAITGYPESLNPTNEPESIGLLYLIPRIFMGIIAVLDTWLVYKIVAKRYGQKTALIAALLFAVLPFSWVFRRILLDNILLPILLGTVLLAMKDDKKYLTASILLSGILMGLAIFTKVPAFAFIPLIVFLVWKSTHSIKKMGAWFVPVVLIPFVWPVYSTTIDQFDLWINDVLWQAGRSGGGLGHITVDFWNIDPVLLVIGILGFAYAGYKRDYFIFLWLIPMLVFLGTVGFTQYFHWNTLIPVFCVAGALLITKIIQQTKQPMQANVFLVTFAGIAVFGIISTGLLLSNDVTSTQFESISFVLDHTKNRNDVTILASPTYTWIFDDIFEKQNVPLDYSHVLYYETPTKNLLVMADNHLIHDFNRGKQIQQIYDQTKTIKQFEGFTKKSYKDTYPFGSMKLNYEGADIQIRTNYKN